jgi:hypothetical protein
MIRHYCSYVLHFALIGLPTWFTTPSANALENQQGPFLKGLLRHARELNYRYSSDPANLSNVNWETAKVTIADSTGQIVLTFDYQGRLHESSAYYREQILNLKGLDGFRIRQLLKGGLPPISGTAAQRQIYLRSISNAIAQQRLLSMDLISYFDGSQITQWMSRLYLMFDPPTPDAIVQFLPAEISAVQDAHTQYLPLISLELSQIGPELELHYLRYLVPAHVRTPEQEQSPHFGIDMKSAYEILEKYRRFAVTILPGSQATVILPSIYDGRDIISDVALEIYALSSYIQGFLDWYTNVWWAEYPLGESIIIKRNAIDPAGLELNLYKFRAHQCGQTVTKDISHY